MLADENAEPGKAHCDDDDGESVPGPERRVNEERKDVSKARGCVEEKRPKEVEEEPAYVPVGVGTTERSDKDDRQCDGCDDPEKRCRNPLELGLGYCSFGRVRKPYAPRKEQTVECATEHERFIG